MLRRRFYSYVIPSLFAFMLCGMYAIVDGIFVGHAVGDAGLAAINVAYPITALFLAIGTGIGMGGAVRYSICSGAGDKNNAKLNVAATLNLLLAFSVFYTIVIMAFLDEVIFILGARDTLASMCYEYLIVIAYAAFVPVFSTGVIPLVRNFGYAKIAMWAMITGFITNILLDWLFIFVFDWGLTGAALATIVGESSAFVFALGYMIYKRDLYLNFNIIQQLKLYAPIVRISIAPFGLTISPCVILIIINNYSGIYGGNTAIAVYAVLAYIICVITMILQAVGEGAQPLFSHYFGAHKLTALFFTRNLAYKNALLFALIGGGALFFLRDYCGPLFGASYEVSIEVANVMPIFVLGLPFIAIIRVTTECFYATEFNKYSYVLTYMEAIMLLIFLQILPPFLGQYGVWWAVFASQFAAALVALGLKYKYDQKLFSKRNFGHKVQAT